MKDIYDILRELRKRRSQNGRSGQDFALATLVRAEGSSYRRPGARMLLCEDGSTIGSLSAGCIEDEVASRGREVLRTGKSTLLSFDTRRRFGCNGKIDIFIEPAPEKSLVALADDLAARRSHVVVTRYGDDEFVQEIHPPIRLLIFGDGLDSGPIRKLCELLGWQSIEAVDPGLWPVQPDEWTATLIKTHNYGRDFVALQNLLPMNLRYVGLIGPRKRRDQLLNALLEHGITINAGFFAPAGLDLHSETPEEIALAIISEIQRVFARGSGQSLRERRVSIHAVLECASKTALSKR